MAILNPVILGGRAARGRDAPTPIGGVLKRSFDIAGAVCLILLFSPLLLIVAGIMRLGDPGPVFFSHRRVGFGGVPFGCLKFRTMVTNSSEALADLLARDPEAAREWRETQKLRSDPRITRLGRFLRETSLDELPQLFNVLRGEMSLVGPRPIVAAEVERYGDDIAAYEAGRPGITGLWQVSGRSNCSYADRVGYDVEYVGRWSLLRDIEILVRTVRVVLAREGSR